MSHKVTPNLRFDTGRQQRRPVPLLAAGQAGRWASRSRPAGTTDKFVVVRDIG